LNIVKKDPIDILQEYTFGCMEIKEDFDII